MLSRSARKTLFTCSREVQNSVTAIHSFSQCTKNYMLSRSVTDSESTVIHFLSRSARDNFALANVRLLSTCSRDQSKCSCSRDMSQTRTLPSSTHSLEVPAIFALAKCQRLEHYRHPLVFSKCQTQTLSSSTQLLSSAECQRVQAFPEALSRRFSGTDQLDI